MDNAPNPFTEPLVLHIGGGRGSGEESPLKAAIDPIVGDAPSEGAPDARARAPVDALESQVEKERKKTPLVGRKYEDVTPLPFFL
ncbi:UNVERIFIED_CONTAM: hypothetical protein Sradi_5229200 [Sesamum radiatum]|uniref:Uncharacterized protein n=1 Tax=Sesamum radiatum TaxID=300843 RepID=A0AAW2LMI1_SESRA